MKILNKANKELLYRLSLLFIFLLALCLRIYRLAKLPDALNCDEAALGYNAWCLAHYGVDRYLNDMPFYPQNFNGGQSPLYTYIVVLLLAAFGKGGIPLFLVRLPGFVSSMLVVIFGTRTISRIFHSRKITIICALLLTVCPYYIMHGRFALDCNMMLGCSVIALYHLVKYIQSGRLSQLIICGVSFGIVLYSYALSYLVISMFLCLAALYLLYTGKITIPRTVIWAAAVCITALPVILFIICLLFKTPPMRFLGFTISPIASSRMSEVSTVAFGKRALRYLGLPLTYGTYPFDAVEKFYTMFPVSIPFITIGFGISIYDFVVSVIKRTFHFSAVFLLFFLCSLTTMGLVGGTFICSANYFFAPYIYFLISGILGVAHFLRTYRKAFLGALISCYLLWSLSFIRYYYTMYSVPAMTHHTEFLSCALAEEPIAFVEKELQPRDIYFQCAGTAVYYFFYAPVSPFQLQETGAPDNDTWGNHHFTVDGDTPVSSGNAYIVRKENYEFLDRLYQCGLQYDLWEYGYYYVIYCR